MMGTRDSGARPPGDAAATEIRRIETLAASGNADALYQIGLWHLIGNPLPRDLPRAREYLGAARARGHADATMSEVALCANGSGAPVDWHGARVLLERGAAQLPAAKAQAALLDRMTIDDAGMPDPAPRGESLTADHSIVRFEGFATAAECAHVAGSVTDILRPAMVIDPTTGREAANPIRTSDSAVIGPTREDLVVRALNLRIAAASGTQAAQGEALTILRYRPGQQFRLHSDAIAGARNQRISTMLVYLNDAFDGGATTFPSYGLTYRPRIGDALLFHNVRSDGMANPGMRHAGLPLERGTKWLATRWIRQRPFSAWTGPEV